MGGPVRPANKPTASSQCKSLLWLRRSLSRSCRTSKRNNALGAGTSAEPGELASLTRGSPCTRANQGRKSNHPATRVRRRRPGARLHARAAATTVVSGRAASGTGGCRWGRPRGGCPKRGGTAPACPWARNRQTSERPAVSRAPHCWAISDRRRPAMQQARRASYWRGEVATGARKTPRQPVSSRRQTSVTWIDFPRVEGSPKDVKVQRPQEPQADPTTASAVCEARHRRRRVAQSPWVNHPRGKINRSTLPSQVIRFSGQKLRNLIPDCCSISPRGNRR